MYLMTVFELDWYVVNLNFGLFAQNVNRPRTWINVSWKCYIYVIKGMFKHRFMFLKLLWYLLYFHRHLISLVFHHVQDKFNYVLHLVPCNRNPHTVTQLSFTQLQSRPRNFIPKFFYFSLISVEPDFSILSTSL